MNVTSRQEWSVSKQKIICNDCVAEMKFMPEKSVDVVVTSPPYNTGIKYKIYQDRMTNEAYLTWLCSVGLEIKRVLKDDGSLFLNIGNKPSLPYVAMQVCVEVANHTGLILQNNIVWVKSITINDVSSGHFKPICGERYLNNQHESIFQFTKDGQVALDRLAIGVPYADKFNEVRWEWKNKLRCGGNVWFMPYKTSSPYSKDKQNWLHKKHPAEFPVELPTRCIKLHGIKENMTVLDPFSGVGNTLLACKNLDINGIGIEIDQNYCQVALERLN